MQCSDDRMSDDVDKACHGNISVVSLMTPEVVADMGLRCLILGLFVLVVADSVFHGLNRHGCRSITGCIKVKLRSVKFEYFHHHLRCPWRGSGSNVLQGMNPNEVNNEVPMTYLWFEGNAVNSQACRPTGKVLHQKNHKVSLLHITAVGRLFALS